MMLDQYLRLPAPSPPPDDTTSEISGATMINNECNQSRGGMDPLKSSDIEQAIEGETDLGQGSLYRTTNIPRIQL
jgi:hypothetical protein